MNLEKIPQPEANKKQASWGKSCKTGEIPQPEAIGKQAGWGKSRKTGRIPQPEAIGKQACWGKSRKTGKIPQPEANKKQASGGKSRKIGKIPQPEAKGKQAGWGKSGKTSHKAPIGFGRGDSDKSEQLSGSGPGTEPSPHRKRPCRISPLSGENLLYNMQKPHIIITKYANKDLRDENNCVAI